jgi:hypothetical protein
MPDLPASVRALPCTRDIRKNSTLPLKSINGPLRKSQHPNFRSWLIIGLLRRSWQRHLEVHQCRLQAQELYFKLGTFSLDSMEVVCLH